MRVLVVEDESKLATLVCGALRGASFCPDHAVTLADARALVGSISYEALVLDLALPDGDGLALLREIRGRGSDLPVLALTARDSVEDRVAGLDAGADDYLVKPFAMEELPVPRCSEPVHQFGRPLIWLATFLFTIAAANAGATG